MEERKEKIEFQYIMNYKAYRRKMVAVRSACTAAVAGAMFGFAVWSIWLAIIFAVMALSIGSITVLVSFANEQTYTVYDTRIVIKKRNSEKRASIDIDNIIKVGYHRAIYEKDLATGTVKIKAKDANGKTKTYRLLHIFDAQPMLDYLKARIENKGSPNGNEESK